MFDPQPAARPQQSVGPRDDPGYQRQPVGAAEHRLGRVVLGDLRIHVDTGRDVRRVAQHQVDRTVQCGQGGRVGHVAGDHGHPRLERGDVATQPDERGFGLLYRVHRGSWKLEGDGQLCIKPSVP